MGDSVAGRAGSVGLALALVALLIFNVAHNVIDIRYAKGQKLAREMFVKWNSFSRIGLAPERGSGIPMIFIDADASTGIANFDYANLSPRDRHDLLEQGPGLPYVLRPWRPYPHHRAGRRLGRGARAGLRQQGRDRGGDQPHHRPDGHAGALPPVEPRPLTAAPKSASSWRTAAVTCGGAARSSRSCRPPWWIPGPPPPPAPSPLSENNLYTTDAFRDYLTHLTPDGIAAFTRWGFDPPRESLRLISLAMEALRELGEPEPWRHVMVGREGSVEGWGARDTVVISRKPFTAADLARARAAFPPAAMQVVYLPAEDTPRNEFRALLRSAHPREYQAGYQFDITPVNDNRPFFFYTVQPRDIWKFVASASHDSADYKINRAVPLLFGLMGISLLATLIILALPPFVLRTRLPRERGVLSFLLYFPVHRRRLHPHRGGPDSEIRALPRAPHLRAHRRHLLHAGGQRAGQPLQPATSWAVRTRSAGS